MANDRTQAQDAASWYFSHLDPFSPNHDNIRRFLRGPLLAVTIKALYCTTLDPAGGGGAPEEEKKASESWREYLDPILAEETFGFNEKGQSAYDSLSRRTKARMEAFLAGCTLAVPGNVPDDNNDKSTVFRKKGDNMVSLQDGLSGFGISKVSSRILSPKAKPKVPTTPPRVSLAEQGKTLMRKISRPDSIHPQIPEEDLVIRLELYIRTMQRVRTLKEECVVPMEPPKFIKLRARYITRAFVVTAGCVRSMSPVLTRLLNCITMELLAVETLSEEHITKVIRRLVSEYEHGTSFASLAFLSTPEVNADSLLTPIVIKYLRYLQKDWETLVRECELERVLSRALDPTMRNMFKKIEFRSIGHLLEVCHENRSKLQNIELAPNVCAVAENINNLCSDKEALRQALRDLQREVIMVNGHILPPVTSRKELLHLLTQTLNSRTLTADRPRSAKKSKRKVHRAQTYPSTIPTAAETSEDDPALAVAKDGDFLFSSSEMDSSEVDEDVGMKSPSRKNGNRHNFHLSTIDLLTRRLLIAASRTGNGGDAYFVV